MFYRDIILQSFVDFTSTGIDILHHLFSCSQPAVSDLKRMSVVMSTQASEKKAHMVAAKGAPEIMRSLLTEVPEGYDEVCNHPF